MAPEGPVDARSDIYSLGVLYYELLSGVLPFASTHYQEVLRAHVETMPDLTRLPASERGLTGWLLSKSPAERPQSAAALLVALKPSGAGASKPAATVRSAPKETPDKYVEGGRSAPPAQPAAPVALTASPTVSPTLYARSGSPYRNSTDSTQVARQPYPVVAPRPAGRARPARDNHAALIAVVAVGMLAIMGVALVILFSVATHR
jgi:serine/threonine protein kinase